MAFVLSGSDGFKTVSSSALPIFDGDYYSVMLQKTKVNTELFPHPSFDADTLFNPPFLTQSFSDNAVNGALEIVSSSNVARTGTKSLRHINNKQNHSELKWLKRQNIIYRNHMKM